MDLRLRTDAEAIARGAVADMLPGLRVKQAVQSLHFPGDVYLVAVGKAAWAMAEAASSVLSVKKGIVLTKYGHVAGPLAGITCLEAGHPVPDANSYRGTRAILNLVSGLSPKDTVLFLLSGGGSALFELPLVAPEKLETVTEHLLKAGADIGELNTIRKRLSAVKGGRFALSCPARMEAIILSDVLGDRLDLIASGPAAPDTSTCAEALAIAEKYGIRDPEILSLLAVETPKELPMVRSQIVGSVSQLCQAACNRAEQLGYRPTVLTDRLTGEASQMGIQLARLLKEYRTKGEKIALIAGGETVVTVRGKGVGGRNQELALAAAKELAGTPGICLLSIGSDGTDGPTDAAGGYADGDTLRQLAQAGVDYRSALADNDSYHALGQAGNLIITGPTGTNVNDLVLGLIAPTGSEDV